MSNVDVPHDNNSAGNEPESPADDSMPDWLKDVESGSGGSGADTSLDEMSDLERLLAEEGIDLGSVEEDRPSEAEGMSARDWMISTSDDEMIRKRIGAVEFDEMASTPQSQSESPAAGDDPFASMSDLERLLAEEGVDLDSVDEERPEEAEGMSVRDWMISTSDDEMIRNRVGAVEFEALQPPAQPGSTPKSVADEEEFSLDEALPDWLQDVDEEEAIAPASADQVEADAEEVLPDWLRGIEEDDSEPEPAVVAAAAADEDKMVVEEDLPDWLRDVEDEVESEPSAVAEEKPVPVDTEEGLPDWLRDVEEEIASEPEPIAIAESDDEGDKIVVEEDLPDWLRDVEEEPSSPQVEPALVDEDGLPDWLQDVQDETLAQEPKEVAEAATSISGADNIIEEDELPDWLQEVEVVSEDLMEEEPADLFTDEEAEEVPEWLTEVQADEAFEPSEPAPLEPEEMAEEDLPDWLRDVEESPDLATLEEEPVVEFSAETVTTDDTMIEEDGLPDWLQEEVDDEEFEPVPVAEAPVVSDTSQPIEQEKPAEQEIEPAPPPPEPEPVAEPTPIVEPISTPEPAAAATGVPDWLKKLRESDQGTAPPPSEPVPTMPVPVQPAAVAAVPVQPPSPPPAASPPAASPQPAVVTAQPPAVPVAATDKPVSVDLPDDPDDQLKMAQSARDDGDTDKAAFIYEHLVSSGTHLDAIINDVEMAIRAYPSNYRLYQIKGDAMMRDGRLQGALESYRQALERLSV